MEEVDDPSTAEPEIMGISQFWSKNMSVPNRHVIRFLLETVLIVLNFYRAVKF